MDNERTKKPAHSLEGVGRWACVVCIALIIAPIIVFLAIGLLSSLIAHISGLTAHQVSGVYQCSRHDGVRAKLVVYPNGTFSQSVSVPGRSVLTSSGRWRIHKEYLTLDGVLYPELGNRFVPKPVSVTPGYYFFDFYITMGEPWMLYKRIADVPG
jgi:hypothetical protein